MAAIEVRHGGVSMGGPGTTIEFDFRYSNRQALGIDDATRAALTVRGAKGKRLTYAAASGSEEEATA